jgi:hypothetical protein
MDDAVDPRHDYQQGLAGSLYAHADMRCKKSLTSAELQRAHQDVDLPSGHGALNLLTPFERCLSATKAQTLTDAIILRAQDPSVRPLVPH